MAEAITNFDLSVLYWIVEHVHNKVLDFLMPIFSLFGEAGIFWIAVTLILLIFPKTRKMGVCSALALLAGFLLGNGAIKHLVNRVRPYELDEALRSPVIFFFPGDSSFPSGHSLASFEAAVSIFLFNKKWGAGALVIAVLVAISRLYLTVHFLTDVLAGAILGTAIAVLMKMIVDAVWTKLPPVIRGEKKKEASAPEQ